MAFDPDKYQPVYNEKIISKETKKTEKASADTPSTGNTAGGKFDPSSYNPVSVSDETVQKNWWNKFSEGMMAAVDTFNYQVGTGARGTMQMLLPESAEKALKLDEQQQIAAQGAAKARQEHPNYALAGDIAGFTGDIVNKTAMGMGLGAGAGMIAPKAAAAVSAATEAAPKTMALAKGAVSGAGFAGTQYAPTAEEKIKNIGEGAMVGLGGTAALQSLGYVAKNAINQPLDSAKEMLEKGKGTLGQILNRPGVQKAEQILSYIPGVGTKKALQAQIQNFDDLTQKFQKQVGDTPSGSMSVKATGQPAEQAGFYLKSTADKLAAKEAALYKKFTQAAGKAENKILLPATQKQAGKLLSEQTGIFNLPGGEELKQVMTTMNSMKAMHPRLLQSAEKFLNTAYEKTAATSPTAARDILKVKNALQHDIGMFAKRQGGELSELYSAAKQFTASKVKPFTTNATVDQFLSGKLEANKLVNSAIKSNRPEYIKTILQPLGNEGRAAFRNAYLDDAYNAATKSGSFNPLTWHNEIKKLKATTKGLFTQSQQKELQGLQKLIEHSSGNIKAGMRTVAPLDYLIGAGGVFSGVFVAPVKTAALAGGIKSVSTLLTNPKVGKFLIKMAEAKSPSEVNSFVTRFVKNLSKTSAAAVAKPETQQPEIDYRIK